jgi:hypothetical protein
MEVGGSNDSKCEPDGSGDAVMGENICIIGALSLI